MLPKDLAARVVRWQRVHGRSGLPWQNTRDPYRVWLSEIMLQQTQVVTVVGYYARFLERFPDVTSLAAAAQDDVMALWSGLGYYSRARNLHRCAQAVVREHGGSFPTSAEQLAQLPGIGRSTAAAIASFCFDERVAILDANVARVLSRVLAFGEDLARSASQRTLWNFATNMLPAAGRERDMPAYTQGLMDLGATVCGSKQARCGDCPLQACCSAHQAGTATQYPVKTRSVKRHTVALWLLLVERTDGAFLLCKRPQSGIWAGLYCLPVFESARSLAEGLPAPVRKRLLELPVVQHALTHRELYLHPVHVRLPGNAQWGGCMQEDGAWFSIDDTLNLGLPAPVRKLLASRPAKS